MISRLVIIIAFRHYHANIDFERRIISRRERDRFRKQDNYRNKEVFARVIVGLTLDDRCLWVKTKIFDFSL